MNLFIVESPHKCAKLKQFLGDKFVVLASYGHIREIRPTGMNIDIKNFEPQFSAIKGKAEIIKKIKDAAEKAQKIFLATAPREGAGIAFSIYYMLAKKDQDKCVRVSFSEITKKSVLDSLNTPLSISEISPLVNAQKARQVLDRLIGYSVSPLLWIALGPKLSAGRVQSVSLRLICDRQKEVNAFIPENYWFIESLLGCKTGEFKAKVITQEKDNRYIEEKVASADMEKLKSAMYTLDKIDRKTKSVTPYPPFDSTSLIKACSVLFGWSASKTMQVAQTLYETGKQTYLRTDSYNVSKEAIDETRDYIKDIGKNYLPDKPQYYSKKSSAAAQEAHEAIRPSHIADDGSDLSGDEKKLYDLLRARLIASQMAPMTLEVVTYHIKANTGHNLIAHGQVVKFDGWFKVYPYSKIKDEVLPEAKEGEVLKLKDIDKSLHTTQPPAKFNDGSLVEQMESEGIGRPSTRAPILKALRDKGYVDKDGKAFTPTDLGMRIVDYLTPRFRDFFMDIKFTAGLEGDLDLIAENKKSYLEVVKSVYDLLQKKVAEARASTTKREAVQTGATCPVCKKGKIVEKVSRYGKFFSCDQYPACKQILIKNENGTFSPKVAVSKVYSEFSCPKCNGKMIVRESKYGKFHGCDNYPKCRGMRKEDGTPAESKGKRWRKKK